jgi:hypothetical protein
MIDYLKTLLADNPLIAGGATMALVGWLMVQARAVPMKIINFIRLQFSTTMTIYSEDTIFRYVDLWLARHPDAKHSRRFGVANWHDRDKDEDDYALTPGAGLHLLRSGWRFFLVNRTIDDKGDDGESGGFYSRRRKQTISITTFGRSQNPLALLLTSIKTVQEDKNTVPVYLWSGHDYHLIERRPKRDMDTVYLAQGIKDEIIADLTRFLGRREWYAQRGIPYRRGYSLEGPPGTGKTTLIFALASLLEKPVYIINPATIDNDNQLQRAINCAGSNFVVIEDIDAIKAAGERAASQAANDEKDGAVSVSSGEASKSGITLSGLLNAIDGIGARAGRVLFITSNHADTLDAALLRPGRVDKRFDLMHADAVVAAEMFEKFFPGHCPQQFVSSVESLLPLSPADLQNRLLGLSEIAA